MYRSLHLLIAVGGLVCAYGLTRSNAGPVEPLHDYNVPGFVAVLPNEIKWRLDHKHRGRRVQSSSGARTSRGPLSSAYAFQPAQR